MNEPQILPHNYIVAIGASAGGLEAINELFDNMPEDTGLSFVVVQHLSPDYKSLMSELLTRHTKMKVIEAGNNMPLEPNCVYLIPSKKIMTINKGKLQLQEKVKDNLPNTAIDTFFESLALEKGKDAIGIILSGTGTDGTKGIEEIKKRGGVIMVQDPLTATFDGMPNSAINSGFADLVLPPEMMPDELLAFLKETDGLTYDWKNPQNEAMLMNIIQLIHKSTNLDFSYYKRPTIYRRLARQMTERNITNLQEYFNYLTDHPDEIKQVSRGFLINVTKFFRDKEPFEKIRSEIIPAIFSGKKPNDPVKVWIVACSTGEEVYSLAMLMLDYIDKRKIHDKPIKIFATDIDDEALEQASKGIYNSSSIADIPKELLNKYLMQEGSNYRVIPRLRKLIVFANHNIYKDPPFGRIDLVSCRNMLIYMTPVLQKNILRSLYFALNKGGYLFLGPSENAVILRDALTEIDKKWKIYRCVAKTKLGDAGPFLTQFNEDSIVRQPVVSKTKNAFASLSEIFRDALVEEYSYSGIFIDQNFEVKQAIGNYRSFLNFPENEFNFNLLKMVPPELAVAISTCARKAIKDGEKVSARRVNIHEKDRTRLVNVIVKPYLEQKEYIQPFLVVILNEEEVKQVTDIRTVIDTGGFEAHTRIQELEKELQTSRENLQAVIEEVESTNEELQSSNEEIITSNEELQSTNEELQSLNEELHTVNAEHQFKIKELIELNDDLNNYFRNTAIGQVILDTNLLIKKFTPATQKQINLIESDIGRSIVDISTNFNNYGFINDIRNAIRANESIEREVTIADNRVFLMKIAPYVRADKSIDGAVVTFLDVTEIRKLGSLLEVVLNSSINGIIAMQAVRTKTNKIMDFEIMVINSPAEKMLNKKAGTLKGKKLFKEFKIFNKEDLGKYIDVYETGDPSEYNLFDPENKLWYEVTIIKMPGAVVATFTDITQKKKDKELIEQNFQDLKITSDKLIQVNSKLEQSNFDLLQFASVASHDLKEPLRKIQAFGNILQSKIASKLSGDERNYFEKIIKASNRMQVLIEDVLLLSKLSDTGVSYEQVDLNDVIDRILDDYEVSINEKNAVITRDKLPVIEAIPGQMRQLFQNLISNALKFNDTGRPEINISVVPGEPVGRDDEYICIRVEDNGIGFQMEYKEKIFGIFQRLHTQQYSGSGIGLAICKKISDNHHGFIVPHSEPGKGSCFDVILPMKKMTTGGRKSKEMQLN